MQQGDSLGSQTFPTLSEDKNRQPLKSLMMPHKTSTSPLLGLYPAIPRHSLRDTDLVARHEESRFVPSSLKLWQTLGSSACSALCPCNLGVDCYVKTGAKESIVPKQLDSLKVWQKTAEENCCIKLCKKAVIRHIWWRKEMSLAMQRRAFLIWSFQNGGLNDTCNDRSVSPDYCI